jgi:hypothetical protein
MVNLNRAGFALAKERLDNPRRKPLPPRWLHQLCCDSGLLLRSEESLAARHQQEHQSRLFRQYLSRRRLLAGRLHTATRYRSHGLLWNAKPRRFAVQQIGQSRARYTALFRPLRAPPSVSRRPETRRPALPTGHLRRQRAGRVLHSGTVGISPFPCVGIDASETRGYTE